jgi:hypothetical protein
MVFWETQWVSDVLFFVQGSNRFLRQHHIFESLGKSVYVLVRIKQPSLGFEKSFTCSLCEATLDFQRRL